VVSKPGLVTWRPAYVTVERASDRTRGVVVTDLLGSDTPPASNASVAVDVDAKGFRDHFLRRIATLP
jgi:purine nucleosidase